MYRDNRFKQINISGILPFVPVLVFSLVFIVGVLLGCMLVGRVQYIFDYSSSIIADFVNTRSNGKLLSAAYDSFINTFPIYLIAFIQGTSFVGCVSSPILMLLVGFKFGLLSGNLYMSYGLEGIMFNALLLMPVYLSIAYGLFMLSKEAFAFSFELAKICIKTNKPVNVYLGFRAYCIKSASTLICLVISIILDVGLSSLFISYFAFL